MKRALVFAHYDKDNIVDEYVLYYLKALKDISDEVVFVSCNTLIDKSPLENLASKVIDEEHKEYDFGSYKRGYLYLKDRLDEFDELVFVNDSCYGPFYSLKNVFEKMENADCDFWGISKNNFGYGKSLFMIKRPHIQSYFVAFKKKVFLSEIFDNFMRSITFEENKRDVIIKYEIGLSEILTSNGFKSDEFIKKYEKINNIAVLKWRQIIQECGMPLLKCSVPRLLNRNVTTAEDWEEIIPAGYPVELIKNNIQRLSLGKKSKYSFPKKIKRIFFDFISGLPYLIKKPIARVVFRIFPYIKD